MIHEFVRMCESVGMAQTVCVLPPAEDRERLLAVVADRNRPLKHVQRARIVLYSADRLPVQEVARRASISPPAVCRWQARYAEHAVECLLRDRTPTLFAAPNIIDGTVIGRCMRRHRHQEFIRFLNAVERAVPAGKVIHAIVDNYAAHKQPNVLKWLADHPRWMFHFTPTSASWLNAVEGFFSAITRRQIRRGA